MPKISQKKAFNGAEEKLRRLGLEPLLGELREIIEGFHLAVLEEKDSNGGAAIRKMIDGRFEEIDGWIPKKSGGVDWTKCHIVNGTQVCVGVEIQFSARSDLLIVDIAHLRDAIEDGQIDVGIVATPSDKLSVYLTDRVASYSDALKAVDRAKAQAMPLLVLGVDHDGPGIALPKQKTRRSKE